MKFITLASGSKGNSTFVKTRHTNILVDAGLSAKNLISRLDDINIAPSDIDAIFLTHEHSDHIRGAGILSKTYNIPLYATKGTFYGGEKYLKDVQRQNKNIVYADERIILNDLCIKPFSIPHDTKEPIAYSFISNNNKLCIATDMGHINKNILENLKDASALVIESNHDENMVKLSNYPDYIKNRILGKYGHISNETCAKVICCIMNNKLKNVFLAHISKENNTEDLAYSTVCEIAKNFGIDTKKDINIHLAKQDAISDFIEII